MSGPDGRLGRRVLREDIKEYLVDAILNGTYKPGDRIVETRVAQQLGLSQGPVREALRDLEMFGFVVSEPWKGTRVREVSTTDLVEAYPVRAALEALAARLAATRLDTEGISKLEELLTEMRAAADKDDRHAVTMADIAFHQTIVDASGNRLIRKQWDSLQLATTTLVTVALIRRTLSELVERHEPLLHVLRDKDPDAAEYTMRRHIEELGEWVSAANPDGPSQSEDDRQPLDHDGHDQR